MSRILRSYLFLLLLPTMAMAQDTIPTFLFQQLEDALENQEEETEIDLNQLTEELNYYRNNPLDLNDATIEELEDLQILSGLQLHSLLEYRDNYGPFYSILELQGIRSFDLLTIRNLRPFVKVKGTGEQKRFDMGNILNQGTSRVIMKWKRVLEDRRGFESQDGAPPSYIGSPDHLFMRYKFDYGQIFKVGLTAEKDPGEELFAGRNKQGFDFYSGYIAARDINSTIKDITVGDYSISMGQGLILHNSFGGNKSSLVMNIKKGGRTVRPYSSVNEINRFRGLANTLALSKRFKLTTFASKVNLDGGITQDTTIDTGFATISSIVQDGFHRTESEISRKGTFGNTSYGFVLDYNWRSLQLNLNGLRSNFSIPLDPKNDPYRRYRFRGDQLDNMSLGYSYRHRNMNFFGELARSGNGGTAQIHSVLMGLDRHVDLALSLRRYDRDYQVINPNGFAEASLPINEHGFYIGLLTRPTRRWKVSAYIDMWRNPWLGFRRDAPSRGVEYLTRVQYTIKRKLTAYAQYKYEQKYRNSSIENTPIDGLEPTKLHRLRIHLNYKAFKGLDLRSRAEFARFNFDGETTYGSLLFQDIILSPVESRWALAMRYALFDTDGFDTRIYMYENDVLYEFSIPFYQNRGSRFYAKAKYRLTRTIGLELRYSRTYWDNLEENGSGGQLIEAPTRSEVKAVVKWRI